MTAPRLIDGAPGGVVLLCDHASNAVPPDIDLGVSLDVLTKHIAIDIGAGPLTQALAARLGAPAILATVSRLVIDLHRPPDHPHLIPAISDGNAIPGNVRADRYARIGRFHAPYHRALAALIDRTAPTLLASIHSFTPRLETGGSARPWQVGILSNRDRRAADRTLAALRASGVETGDNEPYSGRMLNMTLNRHGEARGIASVAIEVRQDLIENADGVAQWTDILAPLLTSVRNSLARNDVFTT
ncbi:MAG: N-formylglutamate amidohydrolase [Pseudomonadota bacterium]|nr:N-formylglutamate amidohydrolase [Pseudomonadota bacterium]